MNGLNDRGFGDAVASAHNLAIRHLRNVKPSIITRAGEKKLAAHGRQVRLRSEPLRVAMAVRRISHQDDTGQLPIAHGQFLVRAKRRIFIANRICARRFLAEVAGRKHIHSHDLKFGRLHGPAVDRPAISRDRRGQHFSLLEERRKQAIACPAVLHAFADRQDVGIRRLHVIIHDDAAVHMQSSFAPQLCIGTDSCGNHYEIRLNRFAVFKGYACCPAIPENGRRIALQQYLHAQAFHFRFQVTAAREIELPFHQGVHQVNDRHVAALHLQAASGFQSKQPSADDHCFLPWPGVIKQTARVIEIAKHEHAFFFHSLHRRDQRCASGCNQQFVERRHTAVIAGHGLAFGIDI